MTDLCPQQPDLPRMVSATLSHLREGYDFLAGEMSHAMALIDCGEPGLAREVLQEALRVLDRELVNH
jgi:hypothetical protein